MTSGEGGLLDARPPPSVCPPPPQDAPGAEEAADSGRELTVDGVGAMERGARPESVFPLPPNEGGYSRGCMKNISQATDYREDEANTYRFRGRRGSGWR